MNKNILPFMGKFLVSAVFLGLISFFSCKSSASVQGENGYKLVKFSQTLCLFPEKEDKSPVMDFNFIVFDSELNNIDFINDRLYSGKTASEYIASLIKDREVEYFQLPDIFNSSEAESCILNWVYSENMSYKLFNDRGLLINREIYTYSGGAHGMSYKNYYVFDLERRKALGMNDFFREETEEQFKEIVTMELHSHAYDYFEENPALTDNFFISNEGLGLSWGLYEIAPYSNGIIEIILPWRTIRPLLKHDIMELLARFGIFLFI